MRIGLDIDGVIIDSERSFEVNAVLFSLEHFGEDRIINKEMSHVEDRHAWPKEYEEKWFAEKLIPLAEKSNFMPGACEVIKLLKENGHELIIITARGTMNSKMKDVALEQFAKVGLEFDEYYFKVKDKEKVCKEAGIDVFVDDDYNHCLKAANQGIKTLYFRSIKRKKIYHENIIEINDWGDIYQYIQKQKTDK